MSRQPLRQEVEGTYSWPPTDRLLLWGFWTDCSQLGDRSASFHRWFMARLSLLSFAVDSFHNFKIDLWQGTLAVTLEDRPGSSSGVK